MSIPWNNEPLSALTHLAGAGLAIAGLVLVTIKAATFGTALQVTTVVIFGVSMILLYLMSSVYHSICLDRMPRARYVFRILDHSAVYILIAGTYTPVVLIMLPPAWGWTLFGIEWLLAVIGIILKASVRKFPPWLSLGLYLVMGWLVLIAYLPLLASLSAQTLFWLVAGGLWYTVGAVFFALDGVVPRTRWFGTHELFHLCVMGGSFSHFWMLYTYF